MRELVEEEVYITETILLTEWPVAAEVSSCALFEKDPSSIFWQKFWVFVFLSCDIFFLSLWHAKTLLPPQSCGKWGWLTVGGTLSSKPEQGMDHSDEKQRRRHSSSLGTVLFWCPQTIDENGGQLCEQARDTVSAVHVVCWPWYLHLLWTTRQLPWLLALPPFSEQTWRLAPERLALVHLVDWSLDTVVMLPHTGVKRNHT